METLWESDEHYRDIFENVSDFLYSHDLQGNLKDANLAFRNVFGFTKDDVKHKNIRDIMPERYRKEFDAYMKDILQRGKNEGLMRVVAKDGSERIVEYKNSIIRGSGGPIGVRGSARDITETIRDKMELAKSEERFQQVVENAQEWVWEMDVGGLYTYANSVVEKIIGYKPAEIADRKYFYDFFLPEEKEEFKELAFHSFKKKQSFRDRIYRVVHKNGEIIWLQTSGVPILDAKGNHLGYRGVTADITKQKKTESELMRLSYFDGLTGIANRRYFEDIAEREWRRALREESPFSLLMGDIDYFKNYNDTYGHLEGDECLRKVAAALKGSLKRPGDMVARYGGEEFVILLPDTDARNATTVAEMLRSSVEKLGLEHIDSYISDVVTISLGVASVLPTEDVSLPILISNADQALYQAKDAGRNRISTIDLMASNTSSHK
jgi:diguanylate cyclase (GGDEF)-like protein/PAS domain S-box-containing protein